MPFTKPVWQKCTEFARKPPEQENRAIVFLENVLDCQEMVSLQNLKEFTWSAPSEVLDVLADQSLVRFLNGIHQRSRFQVLPST